MVQAGGQLRSHTVRSGLSMACNEQPDEHDDLIAVLLWTGRTTATEVVSVVGDSVAHLFGLRR